MSASPYSEGESPLSLSPIPSSNQRQLSKSAENKRDGYNTPSISTSSLESLDSGSSKIQAEESGVKNQSSYPASQSRSALWHPRESGERANRFSGNPVQWKRLTQEERQVTDGLDRLRARDLSVHLYNVFALKRRLSKQDTGGTRDRNASDGWRIEKHWTAWPMTPETVPRAGERTKTTFAVSMMAPLIVSREMEEELIAATTRVANFRIRKTIERQQKSDWKFQSQASLHDQFLQGSFTGTAGIVRDRIISQSPEPDIQMPMIFSSKALAPATQPELSSSDVEDEKEYSLEPIADQDYIDSILRPSIRSICSNLDRLLMSLHHSRQMYTRASASRNTRQDDGVTSSNRKRADSVKGKGSRASSNNQEQSREASQSARARPDTGRGIGNADYSEDEMHLTTFHLSEGVPSSRGFSDDSISDDETSRKSTTQDSQSHSRSRSRNPQDTARERRARLGLRDWSEVLGFAGISGAFSPAAIGAARRRCAALFEQDMGLRILRQEDQRAPKGTSRKQRSRGRSRSRSKSARLSVAASPDRSTKRRRKNEEEAAVAADDKMIFSGDVGQDETDEGGSEAASDEHGLPSE